MTSRIGAVLICRILIATASLSIAATASSQTRQSASKATQMVESAEVDANGRCDLEKYSDKPDIERGDAAFTFVVDPDFLSDPSQKMTRNATPTGGGAVGRKPIPFERVNIVGVSGDRGRVFVQLENPPTCGWLPRSALLLPSSLRPTDNPIDALNPGPDPLRMREFSRSPEMAKNELFVKAVLHNARGTGTVEVPYFSDFGRTRIATQRLFNIFEVFDKRTAQDPETGRKVDYYLLGSLDRSRSLLGWVRDRDVYIWPSRMSVYWAGTKQGFSFTQEDMKGAPDIRETGQEPRNRNVRRFPVIGQSPSPEELGNDEQFRKAAPDERKRRIKRVEIIFPAEACPRAATDKQDCIGAEALEQQRRDLEARVRRLKTVDVLFLIDGTESMQPYLRATAAAIASVASNPSLTRELTLRVGAYAYGDYKGNSANVSNVAFHPIVKPLDPRGLQGGGMDQLNDVDSIRRQIGTDLQGDLLEAPYAALIRAATSGVWRSDAGTRVIIHVADAGNREPGKTSQQTTPQDARDPTCRESTNTTLVEAVELSDVVNALAANNIIYLPVNVLSAPNPRCRLPQSNRLFIGQAQKIFLELLKRDKKSGTPEVIQDDPVMLSYDPNQLQETDALRRTRLGDALKRAFDLALVGPAKITAETLCASDPEGAGCAQSRAMLSQFEPIVTRIFESRREGTGFNRPNVEKLAALEQVVRRGFAPLLLPDGREQFTYWVALDPAALTQLGSEIGKFCLDFDVSSKRDLIVKALVGQIPMDQAGEQLSLSDALAKRYSIPLNIESTFLSLDLRTLSRVAQSDSKGTMEFWQTLCKSRELLSGVSRTGWRIDPPKMVCQLPQRGCDGSKGPCVKCSSPDGQSWKYEWEWSAAGVSIFYVPLNYLP